MIYSISHNDLDGYSSQLIVNKYALIINDKIKMFNISSRSDLLTCINDISNKITKEDRLIITDISIDNELAILISNLNLSNLLVIDHHETGQSVSEKYEWYHYDNTKSATLLSFEYLLKDKIVACEFIKYVNAYDLWLESDFDFLEGVSLNSMFKEKAQHYIKQIPDLRREFIFYFIENYSAELFINRSIFDSESLSYQIEYNFLKNGEDLPLDILISKKHYKYIMENKLYIDKQIGEYNIRIFYNMNNIFQNILNMTLEDNKDISFVCHLSNQGSVSFRSTDDRVSVEDIAKRYFYGGGHRNAAAGKLSFIKRGEKIRKDTDLVSLFLIDLDKIK